MRRVIRIKAMQSLYTYFNNKTVNLADVRQKVFDNLILEPDFYNAEAQEKLGFQKLLPVLLDEAFEKVLVVNELPDNQRWLGMLAQQAVATWNNENKKEKERIFSGLVHDLENQIPLEILFWQIFSGLIQMVEAGEERRQNRHIAVEDTPIHELKILDHPYIPILMQALHPEKGAQPLGLKPLESDEMIRISNALFKELPEYITYKQKAEASEADQEDIWKVLYRKLLRSEAYNDAMHERDMRWAENKILLEVRLKATFKNLVAGEVPSFELDNAETDEFRNFFEVLVNNSMDNFEADDELIRKNLKNWDPERVALLDKYLIHLSINEMRQFSHIPVKVTMNEYLEIAKSYSTPGSSGFINGVVDKLASLLKSDGSIRKSAKGLMDNK